MSSQLRWIVLAFCLLLIACSRNSTSSSVVNDYFSALQKHDSTAYLKSLSTEEQQAWHSPVSPSRVTFFVLRSASFHFNIVADHSSKDSMVDVDVVFDSTSDPRLQSLPIGVKQHLRVALKHEGDGWKVRNVQKT